VPRPLAASAASAALDALDASAAAVAAAVKSLQLVVVLLAPPIQQYTGHAQLHGTKRATSVSFLEILVINTLNVRIVFFGVDVNKYPQMLTVWSLLYTEINCKKARI